MLRRCFPPSLRDTLDTLPPTLDETYERILLGIDEEKREYAHRLFQCLAVSVRPLCVEELAEVLAMHFGSGKLPYYHVDWRPEDPNEAILSACSSLVTIANVDGSQIVQFSHFSVKEFLTSDRLAEATANIFYYHIVTWCAHTIIAQASLSVLLYLGDWVDKKEIESFPFAVYAAQHWVDHARFDHVSSRVKIAMRVLFDLNNSSFSTWIWIYDIDHPLREHMFTSHPTPPEAVPLYYATLCGFRNLARHILVTHPQHANARGGFYTTPLHAALAKGDIKTAVLLLKYDANVDALDNNGLSALHIASRSGRHDHVEFLLGHHADADILDEDGETPLIASSCVGELEVAWGLLRRGAAVDFRDNEGWTPLYAASRYGHLDIVSLLIQSGADVNLCQNKGWTPLFTASRYGHLDVVRILIQNGAAVNLCEDDGWTPLFAASRYGYLDVVRLLTQSGAAVDLREDDGRTPLFAAARYGHLEVVRLLLQSGAAVDSRQKDGLTPLYAASLYGHIDIVRLLIQCGGAIELRRNGSQTSSMSASPYVRHHVIQGFRFRSADLHA